LFVRHPIWLRRVATPGARAFGVLFALESLTRALLTTVIPLEALRIVGSAQTVSVLFFSASLVGLAGGLLVPWIVRRTARRWVYTAGVVLLGLAAVVLAGGTPTAQVLGMMLRVLGVVAMAICLNLYIMDHIARRDLGRAEPQRVFYSAAAWTVGPFLGVTLSEQFGPWAAYLASAACSLVVLGYFWMLRLTESPALSQPRTPAPSPLRNIRRYFAQQRLVMAWTVSICRNAWWAMFLIYAPIFAVQSGLGAYVGGLVSSLVMGFMFLIPLWGWCGRRLGLRWILTVGFGVSGAATLLAAVVANLPWAALGLLVVAAFLMVMLDSVGNMPFLLAVRPHERAEMTSVYSTYRDMADMAPPGVYALLLLAFRLPIVFVASGFLMVTMAALARAVHPRLGLARAPAASGAIARPLHAGSKGR